MQITIEKTQKPKLKPDYRSLGFGKHFTDHMFVMDYTTDMGWHSARIIPYQPLEIDPASAVLHYGQAVFEGLKAYYAQDGRILLFRPEMNVRRINTTNDRLCIPPVDESFTLAAMKALVDLEREWVPQAAGTSLYIRPFIFATDPDLVVKPSERYTFMIILSPVSAYYPQGINPIDIYVEPEYVRAVRGGTGYAKFAGNYAASLKAQQKAVKEGCAQVLWLDGVKRRYIEEVGSMNVFFRIGDQVITPALEGSILPGITRSSVIELLNVWGIPVMERRISIDEIYAAYTDQTLKEAFGTGTAAVVSPIGQLCWQNQRLVIGERGIGALAKRLYDTLTGIQTGLLADSFGWTVVV